MSTPSTFAPCVPPCGVIPLHRPWWRRVVEGWREQAARRARPAAADNGAWREQDLRALRGLSARTLRDIGAPEWVHEGREHRARLMLDQLRL